MPAQAPHRRNSATPSAQRRPAYGRGQNASPPGPKGPVPAQAPHRRKQRARHGLAPKGGVHRPAPAKLGHAICTTPARLRARPECLAPGAKRARCPPRPRTSETRPRHPQNAGPLKGEARMPRPRAQRARCPRGHAIRKTPARLRARPECLAPGPKGPWYPRGAQREAARERVEYAHPDVGRCTQKWRSLLASWREAS